MINKILENSGSIRDIILESKQFLGSCDRFRMTDAGERLFQEIIKNKEKISETEFLRNVSIEQMLDEEECWEVWKSGASDEINYYKSGSYYFVQTAGFEFIFGDAK